MHNMRYGGWLEGKCKNSSVSCYSNGIAARLSNLHCRAISFIRSIVFWKHFYLLTRWMSPNKFSVPLITLSLETVDDLNKLASNISQDSRYGPWRTSDIGSILLSVIKNDEKSFLHSLDEPEWGSELLNTKKVNIPVILVVLESSNRFSESRILKTGSGFWKSLFFRTLREIDSLNWQKIFHRIIDLDWVLWT